MSVLSDKAAPLLPASSFYSAPQRLEGIPVATPFLTAILVTHDEAEAAREYGHARILGRLGESLTGDAAKIAGLNGGDD